MNKDEIKEMPAGREMDALIVRKIGNGLDIEWTLDSRVWDGKKWRDRVPHYSTDISAAWEAVEQIDKMIGDEIIGSSLSVNLLRLEHLGNYPDDWAASFDCNQKEEWYEKENIGSYPFASRGETAPLAICRAALLVIMGAGDGK